MPSHFDAEHLAKLYEGALAIDMDIGLNASELLDLVYQVTLLQLQRHRCQSHVSIAQQSKAGAPEMRSSHTPLLKRTTLRLYKQAAVHVACPPPPLLTSELVNCDGHLEMIATVHVTCSSPLLPF